MSMQIIATTMGGDEIILDVDASNRVADVKTQIYNKRGIPCDQQRLMFTGEALSDFRTLTECNLEDGSMLFLVRSLAKQIQINVKMYTLQGKVLTLDVSDSNVVEDLKALIFEQEGIPCYQQRLYFGGLHLEDDFLLSEYGVTNDAVLQLVICISQSMQIVVKMHSGLTMAFDVRTTDTVDSVKSKIQDREGIPYDEQRLIFEHRQLEGECMLSDYNIKKQSILHLVVKTAASTGGMSISVKTSTGKMIALNVEDTDALYKVRASLYDAEGILPDEQRLSFAGKELEDQCTIRECGIRNGSMLDLEICRGQSACASFEAFTTCKVAGACGLHNLGNTCFLNSTLQALSNTVPLRMYYESGDFQGEVSTSPLGMSGRLARGFADLLKAMWAGRHTAIPPSGFRSLIAERCPDFRGYQQHDAQELLMFLLDGLHEDVNRAPYPRPYIEGTKTDGKTDAEVAGEAWSANLLRNDSKIVELFQFQLRSEISFPAIDERSLKFDPMMYLSLPVPSTVASASLEQCLELFTQCEHLAREDWVRCEKTQEIERSQKKLDIWSLPECLVVHLKRFGSGVAGPVMKIDTFIQAPIDLNLSPWIRGPMSEHGAHYKLHAVVNHSGSLSCGHYTASCIVGDGPSSQWYNFNDATVTPLASEKEVVSRAAYILFYQRVNTAGPADSVEEVQM